jgi:hypothetical protein
MSNAGPLEALIRIVGEALGPLERRLQGDGLETVLDELGLRLPAGALSAGNVGQALQASAGACAQLPDVVAQLVSAIDAGDDGAMLSAAASVGQRIVQAVTAFTQLSTALDQAIQGAGGLTPAQIERLGDAARAIPERLVHLAMISYLDERAPAVKSGLALAGLIDDTPVPADPADPTTPPHTLARVRFDRIATLVSDPAGLLEDLYHFGLPSFDGAELFARVKDLVDFPDHEAVVITAPGMPPALDAYVFRLAPTTDTVPGLRIRLRQAAEKDLDLHLPLAGVWSADASAQARFEGGLELELHPDGQVHIAPPVANASVSFAFGVSAAHADGSPIILLGQVGGSRLELKTFSARLPLRLSASTGAASPEASVGAEITLDQGKLVIDTSNSDGFIATLLSGVRVESAFDLSALYDTQQGLRFTGSATIEIAIPTHLTIGPVSVPAVYLIGGFKDGTIPIEFSADIGANLGPLAVSVGRLGAIATISFPRGGGNAGAAQIDMAFKPPNGVGLSVDTGIVKGGGFLYIDTARGEYAGALELTFAGFLSLKAIGIITTRMPDGSPGFSLLILITAEFGTGLQLGFGFTLLGVGGLLGLNRTMRLDALAEGVRTGSITSVMFPKDVVANAPRIIGDLNTFFPPRQGTFLIGPMVKLGWGTPTLVSLSLGVIIEIPGNIAIVGVLRMALPADEIAVVVLQVSFIGAIEFDKSRAWFFASLYDSRVLFITIDGEMGLLVAFGAHADFVLAVGGFHPRYSPPPLPFPSPRRIAIDILNTSVARLRAEGYFAVTTNSVQFGVMAEAFFGFSALNVSGHIQFDALIRFSPFYFIVEFSSSFEVKVFGIGVWGLRIRLAVEGPTPWHAHGSAGISLLFFDIDVDIDITWGERQDTSLPSIAVLPKLVEELSKTDNWRALPPPGSNLLVSLRALPDAAGQLALHPLGTLRISQRFVPLDATLDRVGAQRPSDGTLFSLAASSTTFEKRGDVDEQFAPAQFADLSDNDQLARKAFEPRHGGVALSAAGAQYESGAAIVRNNRYELITVDTNARRHRRPFARLGSLLFHHWLGGTAASLSSLSAKEKAAKVPVADGVTTAAEGFAVAMVADNSAASGESVYFTSEGAAREWMAGAVAADRALAGQLHVLPQFELVTS